MKKTERQVELVKELLIEEAELERLIAALPVGYISVKVISGNTYYYRQWREGPKIISQYVPSSLLNSVKRKIATRKEHEASLKMVRKELKSAIRKCERAGLLNEEEVAQLRIEAHQE